MEKPISKYKQNMDKNEIKCFDCDGTGKMEAANPICNVPKSQCCGGCDSYFTCTLCDGTGIIVSEDDEIINYILMIKSYDIMIKGYSKTVNDYQKLINSVSENGLLEMQLLQDNTNTIQVDIMKIQIKRIKKHKTILQNEIKKLHDRGV